MLEDALAHFEQLPDLQGQAATLNSLGQTYRYQGNFEQALIYFEQALTITKGIEDRVHEGLILFNLGELYEAQANSTSALTNYLQAIDVIETVRASAGSEQGRAEFIAQYASLYANTIDLLYEQKRYEEAFFVNERSRARAFLDSLATGEIQLEDEATVELFSQERITYDQLKRLQSNLAQAKAENNRTRITALEKQLTNVQKTYEEILTQIRERNDQLATLIPGRNIDNIITVSEVQQLLDDQTTLISYYVLEDAVLAFLITEDNFDVVKLRVSRDKLTMEISGFRSFSDLGEPHPDSAKTLYHWLIRDIENKLDTSNLIIVPHSVLHYLPFAALSDGDQYLVDIYTLTTLPSVSTLPFIQKNADHELSSPLILGNPTNDNFSLAYLDFAEREAETIANLYNTTPFIGTAATEAAIWEQVSKAGILHVAAHGGYNRNNPLYSRIVLSPTGENDTEDGSLEVHEVYGLDLRHNGLVVLSACQTQLGELNPGDELVGLTRAFFFAGTPSVIASLWNVNDEATAILMESFYTHLRTGKSKAEAIRLAQIDVREYQDDNEDFPYSNPYFWAAFVLSGDGGSG